MLRLLQLLLLLAAPSWGKVSTMTNFKVVDTQWQFIDKFCFDEKGGTMTIEYTESSTTPSGQQWLFYHDIEENGFPAVYKSGNSCEFKRALSASGQQPYTATSKQPLVYNVKGIRPRWWYIVLANCDNKDVENVDLASYTITFTNDGGKYRKHFSTDEEGIYECAIFSIIYIIGLGVAYTWSFLKHYKSTESRVHHLHMVMMFICFVEFFSIMLSLVHKGAYADDGIGHPQVMDFVSFLHLFPEITLTGVIVFISKGWQISANRIEDKHMRSVIEVLVLYLAACVALFLWNFRTADLALQLSIYQTPPGVILTILRLVILLWFLSNLNFTWRNERNVSKKSFYVGFLFFGLFHFLTLPVVVIVAEVLDTWQRRKAVEITQQLFALIVYTVMWILFGFNAKYIKKSQEEGGRGGKLAHTDGINDVDDREMDMGALKSSEVIDHEDIEFRPAGTVDDDDE